jgi:phosphoadenosine phosphosulfate reductase
MNVDVGREAFIVADAARSLEGADPQKILAWAVERYSERIVLACSFGGPTGIVIIDMLASSRLSVPVYYLETGLLFAETHKLVRRVRERYGIEPIVVEPELSVEEQGERYGQHLWERDPDACCNLRKVEPQRRFLASYDAWITGLRRDQASTRKETPVIQWDTKFGLVKVNPLAEWDERMIWTYIRAHDVPYNQLHDRNYPSVGCTVCTRPVEAGRQMRTGRWQGFDKIECGLHKT